MPKPQYTHSNFIVFYNNIALVCLGSTRDFIIQLVVVKLVLLFHCKFLRLPHLDSFAQYLGTQASLSGSFSCISCKSSQDSAILHCVFFMSNSRLSD